MEERVASLEFQVKSLRKRVTELSQELHRPKMVYVRFLDVPEDAFMAFWQILREAAAGRFNFTSTREEADKALYVLRIPQDGMTLDLAELGKVQHQDAFANRVTLLIAPSGSVRVTSYDKIPPGLLVSFPEAGPKERQLKRLEEVFRSFALHRVNAPIACDACGAMPAMTNCGGQCGEAVYCGQACADAHYPEHFALCEGKQKEKWIQKAHVKKGAFTRKAKKHHESVSEFEEDVLANPDHYSPRTVRQANFARNVRK